MHSSGGWTPDLWRHRKCPYSVPVDASLQLSANLRFEQRQEVCRGNISMFTFCTLCQGNITHSNQNQTKLGWIHILINLFGARR